MVQWKCLSNSYSTHCIMKGNGAMEMFVALSCYVHRVVGRAIDSNDSINQSGNMT